MQTIDTFTPMCFGVWAFDIVIGRKMTKILLHKTFRAGFWTELACFRSEANGLHYRAVSERGLASLIQRHKVSNMWS